MLLSISTIVMTGCSKNDDVNTEETDSDSGSDDSDIETDDNARTSAVHENASDYVYNVSEASTISLNGNSVTSTSSKVTITGTTATITAAGIYSVSGSLTNGQLIVDADGATVKIILNGVTLSNSSTSPFYIKKSLKTIIFLTENTTSTFTDASVYAATGEPNATIFANCDLSIAGNGKMVVNGKYADGISSDDGLIIKSGTIEVTATDDAIRGKDYLIVRDGTINATATTGQAMKSDYTADANFGYITIDKGTYVLTSSTRDGLHASHNITLNGGTLSVSALSSQGGNAETSFTLDGATLSVTKCKEGIESGLIALKNGTLTITATDDALNATKGVGGEASDGSSLVISGGNINLYSSSGDAIDSNGNFTMSGGTVLAHGPQSQPEVVMDVNGTSTISGGTIIASGPNSGQMIETFGNSSTQNSVLIKFSQSKTANSIVHIEDNNGNNLSTFAPVRNYYYLIFSSSDLIKGNSYNVYTGGSSSGNVSNGLYTGGSYTPGTKLGTFTVSGSVTLVNL